MKIWIYALFAVGLVPICFFCLFALSHLGIFGGYMVQYVGPVTQDSFEWRFTLGQLTFSDRDWLFWMLLASLLVGIGWLWHKICAVLSGLFLSENEQNISN